MLYWACISLLQCLHIFFFSVSVLLFFTATTFNTSNKLLVNKHKTNINSLIVTFYLSTKQSLHTARLHRKQGVCPELNPNFLMHMQHTLGCPCAESTFANNTQYLSAVGFIENLSVESVLELMREICLYFNLISFLLFFFRLMLLDTV